eukprot:1161325-Pelagomonas_calceolata.AAC.2
MANLCCGKLAHHCQPLLLLPRSSSEVRVSSRPAGALGSSVVNQAKPRQVHHLQPPLRRGHTRVMAAPEAAGQQQDVASTSSDLLVYGPGVLGSYAGHLWKERMPGARVLGLTNTSNNHDRCTQGRGVWMLLAGWLLVSVRKESREEIIPKCQAAENGLGDSHQGLAGSRQEVCARAVQRTTLGLGRLRG